MAQRIKRLPAMQETQVRFLGWEDPLEREMATHSSILAWRTHGQKSLAGYSPRGCKESDMTEQLHTHDVYLVFIPLSDTELLKIWKFHCDKEKYKGVFC